MSQGIADMTDPIRILTVYRLEDGTPSILITPDLARQIVALARDYREEMQFPPEAVYPSLKNYPEQTIKAEMAATEPAQQAGRGPLGCADVLDADVDATVPEWAMEEIKATWRAARDAGGQVEAFSILERMVDRLGYGRRVGNPSLASNAKADLAGGSEP
jgi:hypothetical protein